jgi:hypothetical protein
MCEVIRNIKEVQNVKEAEIYTHLNSVKQNISEIKTHPKR